MCFNKENVFEGGFLPMNAKEYVESLVEKLKYFYISLGLLEHQPVAITSGIDKTVRFIGSHISVLKPYILNGSIPDEGYFIRQNCLRTRNAKHFFDNDYYPAWGSYFPSFGIVLKPEMLEDGCKNILDFFKEKLNIRKEDILIRVSSKDTDLLEISLKLLGKKGVEKDSNENGYYRHKYGIEGVWGRSFNIALRDKGLNTFFDIGNVIVIENEDKELAVEIALGVSVILKQLYSLEHVHSCYPLPIIECRDKNILRKVEDAIIVSVVLYKEGLRPNSRSNRNRILKKYVNFLSYFRLTNNMSMDNLSEKLSFFELHEFPNAEERVSNYIIDYLIKYEERLFRGKIFSKDDLIIKNVLNF